jgi:hypothetical protein
VWRRPPRYIDHACSCRSLVLSGRHCRLRHRAFDTSAAQRPAPTCMARRTGSCSFSHALSLLGLRWDDPQFFLCRHPINRALGFGHSLGLAGSSAPYGNACVERDRPFPHVPSNALNDAILNAAMLHVVKNRSPQRRLAMRRTLCGLVSAPTRPFSVYAPQAGRDQETSRIHLPASGFVFRGGRNKSIAGAVFIESADI